MARATLEIIREFGEQGTPFIASLSNGKIRLGFKGVEYIDVDPAKGGNAVIEFTAASIRAWPAHDADDALRSHWRVFAPYHRIIRKKAR